MDSNGNTVIAHLSDLHLGYSSSNCKLNPQGVRWREADGYMAWIREIKDIINDGTVDVVLIAGDVFHTPTPSILAVKQAQKGVRILANAGIPVVILTGNHDTSDVRSELAATALLNDPDHGVYSHYEPYATYDVNDDVRLHLISHHLYKEQASTWDKVKPTNGKINIFSTHGSMIDPLTKLAMHTDASPREVIIPDEIVNNPGWDYRLLGHIHERGFVGSSDDGKSDTSHLKTYYNGSLIRRGFSDGETPLGRGWTKWTVQPDGLLLPEFHTVAQRPQEDLPVINALDLSAADITDIAYNHVSNAVEDIKSPFTAPILRQRVVNITPEKRKAVDQAMLSKLAAPALSWQLSMKTIQDEHEPADGDDVVSNSIDPSNGGVKKQFEDWLTNNDAYEKVNESIRDSVRASMENFIRMGQEAVLDAGKDEEEK